VQRRGHERDETDVNFVNRGDVLELQAVCPRLPRLPSFSLTLNPL
jgi:hypothetical protein